MVVRWWGWCRMRTRCSTTLSWARLLSLPPRLHPQFRRLNPLPPPPPSRLPPLRRVIRLPLLTTALAKRCANFSPTTNFLFFKWVFEEADSTSSRSKPKCDHRDCCFMLLPFPSFLSVVFVVLLDSIRIYCTCRSANITNRIDTFLSFTSTTYQQNIVSLPSDSGHERIKKIKCGHLRAFGLCGSSRPRSSYCL